MKPFSRLSFAFAFALIVGFAVFMLAKSHSVAVHAHDGPAQLAPIVKVDPVAHEEQKRLIGQVYGKYGTVCLYDNGKGYRWTEINEKAVYTVYGPGQQRRDVTVELDEPAPVTVATTRWGKVYTDPRLVAGWIDGE